MPLADAQRPDCNCIELGDVVCSSTAHWSSTTKLDWRRMILNVLMSRVVRSCIRICTIGSQLGELGLSLVLRGPVSRIEECLRSLVRVARTCISRYILIPHYGLSSKGGPITLPIASPPLSLHMSEQTHNALDSQCVKLLPDVSHFEEYFAIQPVFLPAHGFHQPLTALSFEKDLVAECALRRPTVSTACTA